MRKCICKKSSQFGCTSAGFAFALGALFHAMGFVFTCFIAVTKMTCPFCLVSPACSVVWFSCDVTSDIQDCAKIFVEQQFSLYLAMLCG